MASSLDGGQVQIKFVTKQEAFAVPDVVFSVPCNVDSNSLNNLVNEVLKENNADILKSIDFDFLVFGELLRVPLIEHLQERHVSVEVTVDVEYVQRTPAPQPQDALLHDDWVSAIEVADRWVLTGCYDNTVNIWSTKGNHHVSLRDHTNLVKGVSWLKRGDPSQGFVSVSHDLTAILWYWEPGSPTPQMRVVLRGHDRGIDSVGVSTDGRRLVTGGWDTHLKLWEATLSDDDLDEPPSKRSKKGILTRTPLHTLKGHKETISCTMWIDPHTVSSASMDHTIKMWDVELCGLKHEIVAQKAFLGASWSPLSQCLITSSADRHIRLYDPRSSEGSVCKTTFTSHTQWVSCVAWSQYDEHLFMSGGYDECVKLWDTRSPKAPLYDLTGHQGKVLCVDWTNPKHLVSGGSDNSVHIFKNVHVD